ncbi:hypothetical protein AB0N29_01820 [Nocardioides sp. NPDC092400]|uniref:hypothetical protein n=1 Tax=Nocardioides sp. NPDC092400 TaxID=3155196 RepID=UPI003433F122
MIYPRPARLAAALVAVLTAAVGVLPAAGDSAERRAAAPLPTSATYVDDKNDISGPRGQNMKGDRDLRSVRAAVEGENIVLTVKVKDLKPAHLRDRGKDGWHWNSTLVAARLFVGQSMYEIMDAAVGTPQFVYQAKLPMGGIRDGKCPPLDEEGEPVETSDTALSQEVDFVRNTVTFVVPLRCIPGETARVSGRLSWSKSNEMMAMPDYDDDAHRFTAKGRYIPLTSKRFRLR